MPINTQLEYPFHLDTSSRKYKCPSCGKRRFVRYLRRNGNLMSAKYGKCDRLDNCGHHKTPYEDNLHKDDDWGLRNMKEAQKTKMKVYSHMKKKTITIPDEETTSKDCFNETAFYVYCVRSLAIGEPKVQSTLKAYGVTGTSFRFKKDNYISDLGSIIFWLKDSEGNIKGGQVALFDKVSGGTIKNPFRHTRPAYMIYPKNDPKSPEWAQKSWTDEVDKLPCFYGLDRVSKYELEKPVAIVEAPKTALICNMLYPQFIWLASWSLSMLTEDRMNDLRNKRVVLFPDQGNAYKLWKEKATIFRNKGMAITVSRILEDVPDKLENGSDIVDYLSINNRINRI